MEDLLGCLLLGRTSYAPFCDLHLVAPQTLLSTTPEIRSPRSYTTSVVNTEIEDRTVISITVFKID